MGVQENHSEELSCTFYKKNEFGKGDSPPLSFSLSKTVKLEIQNCDHASDFSVT